MSARVLNVGGGASRELPAHYRGWDVINLDIDAQCQPDIVCDAREMRSLPRHSYDAIFCSHMLEHFHRHDVPKVLSGFRHVLKTDGFAQIAVPDIAALVAAVAANGGEVDRVWYRTGQGVPITFHDVMYGWQAQVAAGNEYYCHKTAFTAQSLSRILRRAEFPSVLTATDGYNVHAFAFNRRPNAARRAALGI